MRKNLLQDLVGEKRELTAVNSEQGGPTARAAPLGSKGAVGAMSRALAQMSDRDAETRQDRSQDPDRRADVVELDTASIVDTAFKDRLEDADVDGGALLESIRAAGQQIPILVRPEPGTPDRYQIAYGRRRLAVLRRLERPVRALIRTMTDDEMIVAQGTENGARKDLSFIERSHFAWLLEDRGIARSTIMAALSVDKTELSRLISVMRSMPADLVEWIGPAPKAGRRRWMDLAELLKASLALDKARRLIDEERPSERGDSDSRFAELFSAVTAASTAVAVDPARPRVWQDEAGRCLARVSRSSGRFILSIDERLEPTFGDFLLERLPNLLHSFRTRSKD